MPLFVRKFILDFVETGLAAIFALTLAFPTNGDQTRQVAVAIGLAILSAAVSAARRAYPQFVKWLGNALGTAE